jgi:hypothetical protein
MSLREHRLANRAVARTIAHLLGGIVRGTSARVKGDAHADTQRLHDALSNARVPVRYTGDGRNIQLR